jgi:hypothetical protein
VERTITVLSGDGGRGAGQNGQKARGGDLSGGEQGEHQPRRVDRILNQPNMNYSATPLGLPLAAQFFSRAGYIK